MYEFILVTIKSGGDCSTGLLVVLYVRIVLTVGLLYELLQCIDLFCDSI